MRHAKRDVCRGGVKEGVWLRQYSNFAATPPRSRLTARSTLPLQGRVSKLTTGSRR